MGHLRKHNIKAKEYKILYPNALFMDDEQKKIISNKTKNAINQPKTKEKYLESRKKIDYSKFNFKYDRENKDIKKKMYSQERNKKISEARKKYWEDKKGKTVEQLYGEETGKAIREIKSRQNSGVNNPAYGKIYNNAGRVRGYYKGYFFRSLWECSFLKFLEENGTHLKDVDYEKINISYTKDGGGRTYTPDYYLPKEKKLIEIKSKWNLQRDAEDISLKRKAAEKWCKENDSTYQILTEDDFPILKLNQIKNDKNIILLKNGNING
jgi:hypothetical protein